MLALDQLFTFSALIGGILFLVQLILMFLGGHADVDTDVDLNLDGDVGHATADVSFKVLSLQGITAFVMMFGLVGWAMRRESHAEALPALAAAVVAGSVSVWIISKLFAFFNRLQSTGTLNIQQAVGATGQVYLTVSPGKPGKVTVTVGTRSLTLEAITEKNEVLETGTPVRVVRVISDTSVSVERS